MESITVNPYASARNKGTSARYKHFLGNESVSPEELWELKKDGANIEFDFRRLERYEGTALNAEPCYYLLSLLKSFQKMESGEESKDFILRIIRGGGLVEYTKKLEEICQSK